MSFLGSFFPKVLSSFDSSRRRVSLDNIYHCTVPKAGSQWIKHLFSDGFIFQRAGLKFYTYQNLLSGKFDPRKLTERSFHEPFPLKTISGPLYISYDRYSEIRKPKRYKTFFIMRDPRDLLVSFYFSMRYSHSPIGAVRERREHLLEMDTAEGIRYCLDIFRERGHFEVERSWTSVSDENVMVIKYEDLISDKKLVFFASLFEHCEISLTFNEVKELVERHSFKKKSKREAGEENKHSHQRKGMAGDWKNHFSDDLKKDFKASTDDLLMVLGYESNDSW